MTLRWVDPPTVAADVAIARRGMRPWHQRHPMLAVGGFVAAYLAVLIALAYGIARSAPWLWAHRDGAFSWLILAYCAFFAFRFGYSHRRRKL